MIYVIKSIGLLIVILGVVLAALPVLIQRIIEFIKIGKRVYVIGAIRIILGGALAWASPAASIMLIPAIVGGLMVASGLSIFFIGTGRMQAILDWWTMRSDGVRRLLAALAACIGALIIYAA